MIAAMAWSIPAMAAIDTFLVMDALPADSAWDDDRTRCVIVFAVLLWLLARESARILEARRAKP